MTTGIDEATNIAEAADAAKARRLRVFISSPGDVAEERVLANNLVRRLSDEFERRLRVEPVFWEHEPLLATSTFQKQIPPPRDCEVCVCVLWSRIGTRLPADITRPAGTRFGPAGSRYASGTEYEFEDAALGFEHSGHPQLLVYRKTAEPTVSLKDKAALLAKLEQKEALDAFIQRWFFDAADGTLKAAFHTFETSAQFEQVLEEHLRKLIARRLETLPALPAAATPARPSWTSGSPFRGLEAFEFEHAPVFFGRTRAVGDVLAALRKNAAEGRAFVLITGVSGGGKSSLARAGVLPVLTQPGVVEGVGLWRRAVARPADAGGDPFAALAAALLRPDALPELASDGTAAADLAGLLRNSPAAAAALIRGALAQAAALLAREQKLPQPPAARLVLLVDQLEELFTLTDLPAADRAAYIDALDALCRGGRVFMLATLRGDFYPRCFALPVLMALGEGTGQYVLALPTPAEIGQMVRGPARAAGLCFEENPASEGPQAKLPLDEALREAAASSPESLPLLEFALDELFRLRTPAGLLTWAAYRDLGGVEGALSRRAEAVYGSLPADVRGQMPRVMRALVSVGEAGSAAAPLAAAAPEPVAAAFVEAFVKARLLVADREDAATDGAAEGGAVVAVAHEALLRNWPRLARWLEQDRDLLRSRDRVDAAAKRWEDEGRRPDLLLGEGRPLGEAQAVVAGLGDDLDPATRRFIRASAARAASRRRLKRAAVAALSVLTGTSLVAGGFATRQRSQARESASQAKRSATAATQSAAEATRNAETANRNATVARDNLRQAEARLAEGLVLQGDALALAGRWFEAGNVCRDAYARFTALGVSPFRAEAALSTFRAQSPPPLLTLTGHADAVSAVSFSPDGRRVLTGSRDNSVKLWDLTTGRELRTLVGHTGWVRSVAFSPDGTEALIGGWGDPTVRLWDLSSGRQILRNPVRANGVSVVAFGVDGRTAFSDSLEGIKVWDLSTGRDVSTFIPQSGGNFVGTFSLTPDRHTAICGGYDHALHVWDTVSGHETHTIKVRTNVVGSVAISADGRTALSGGDDDLCVLWDVATGNALHTLRGHTNGVNAVAISPDGRVAISASDDSTCKVWDVSTGDELMTLQGHTGKVLSVALSPDGRTALSGSTDGTSKLWDLSTGRDVRTFRVSDRGATSVAVSPDGRTALAGDRYGVMFLWDLPSGCRLQQYGGHGNEVKGIVFRPDGRTAMSCGDNKTFMLWDLATGKEIRGFDAGTLAVEGIALSPDGHNAVSGTHNGLLKFWDVDAGREGRSFDVGHQIASVAWSPDGRTILSGGYGGSLEFWDAGSARIIRSVEAHSRSVVSLAFSPDGRTAASGSWDGTVKLWDVSTGQQLRTFGGNSGEVYYCVKFGPDGNVLISGGRDGAKVWDVSTGREIRALRGPGSANGVSIGPDGHLLLSCGGDGTVRVWDLGRTLRYLDFEKAVPSAQSALRARPEEPAPLATLGEWYAFRGRNDWAAELMERARAGGVAVDPMTLGRCYWELAYDVPAHSGRTRTDYLRLADREFTNCLAGATKVADQNYVHLCLD